MLEEPMVLASSESEVQVEGSADPCHMQAEGLADPCAVLVEGLADPSDEQAEDSADPGDFLRAGSFAYPQRAQSAESANPTCLAVGYHNSWS
jgi:hypothetical protein